MTASLLSLAFYLPQFHPIPENDAWWGTGFTEWSHFRQLRSWFDGHVVRQPVSPLGRYSLLDPTVIEAQQAMAQAHGIDGFLVWNYWFGGGRQLLERPVDMILRDKLPVTYALAWANHDWRDQARGRSLMKQQYLGVQDYAAYFHHCLPHFRSERYVLVDGKPLFFIYRPEHIPDLEAFVALWRDLARANGLAGLHIVGDLLREDARPPAALDAYTCAAGFWAHRKNLVLVKSRGLLRRSLGLPPSPERYSYDELLAHYIPPDASPRFIPTVFTGWDSTPRHGGRGVIVEGLTPEGFRVHLDLAQQHLLRQTGPTRLVFIKSWNEWAEGNLIEPDQVYGDALLKEYGGFAERCRAALATDDGAPST